MKAIILAGGKGTRLNPIISDVPKPMAPINGRPFLELLVNYWINQGVDHFIFSVGYMAEVIQYHFGSNYRGCSIEYVFEDAPLGTGGAILKALDHLDDLDEPVLVSNGDSFASLNLESFKDFHESHLSEISIALSDINSNDRYSGVLVDSSHRVRGFQKREADSSHLTINLGSYIIHPDMLLNQKWNVGDVASMEDEIFPYLIEKGWGIYGYKETCRFIDIGVPQDYQKAQDFLKNLGQLTS